MTDDNSKSASSETPVDMDNLDAFEDEFFQREPEEADLEDVEDDEEVPETELETDEDEPEADAEEDDLEEDEEPEEEPKPKPKGRKSAQERIDELVAERYARDRELDKLRQELAEAKAGREEKKEPTLREALPANAPDPDAVDEKGEPIYPLGEFDKAYIRDLTKFTIAEETKAAKEAAEKEAAQKKIEAEQAEIVAKWSENLEEVEKDIPEIRENITHLVEVFKDVDEGYGEFLATAIMADDAGPLIMNYLSTNIGEAQKIVASGPAAAMIALGKIAAKFAKEPEQEKQRKRVSSAPPPAEQRTRGQHGRFTVSPDTDDLDAFERVFFKKKA